jgi:diadenosine tetraphosphate (Ap4A) HIT family hydrolase
MSGSKTDQCPFCNPSEGRVTEASGLAFAMLDAYPVSPGHTLVVVRRHVADVFDLRPDELADVARLIASAKRRIDSHFLPRGYNVGVNVGQASGQTIMHVHVHLIPRYPGDCPDPTGGVRNVIPGRGPYVRM